MGAALIVIGILTSESSPNALVIIGAVVVVVFLMALGSVQSVREPRLGGREPLIEQSRRRWSPA